MKKLAKFLTMLIFLSSGVDINATNPESYEEGRYDITMVLTTDNHQADIRHSPLSIWFDIYEDHIILHRKHDLYTPEFGEGESIDLNMKIVDTKDISVRYDIVKFDTVTNEDGSTSTSCICKNEDGDTCNFISGIVGTISDGRPLRAFYIEDSIFDNIYWCYEGKNTDQTK